MAVVAAALSAVASSASAGLFHCSYGCYLQTAPYVDYTVPDDGRTYRWDVWTDSTDPSITVQLLPPNETFTVTQISNGDGTLQTLVDYSAPYSWQELSVEPNHASYLVSAPASFNDCDPSSPAGQICAVGYNVWGNGRPLILAFDPALQNGPLINIFISETAVPEPQTWALMIAGFGFAGAMLRRAKRVRGLAA